MDESWRPANDTERALLRAAQTDDRARFFQILTRAELYLPQLRDDTEATGQRFVTMDLFGQPFLPVFTSVETMAPRVAEVAEATAEEEIAAADGAGDGDLAAGSRSRWRVPSARPNRTPPSCCSRRVSAATWPATWTPCWTRWWCCRPPDRWMIRPRWSTWTSRGVRSARPRPR